MKELTSADSINDLLSSRPYSLLYFTASWCGPCQSMLPVMKEVASAMNERVNIVKIDVDNMSDVASSYGVRSVPTLMLMRHDEIIDQRVGGVSSQQLTQWIEKQR